METLEIKNLSFSYSASLNPLLRINAFSIKTNEKVFLKGDSGSGKTTLLGLITGILSANSGELKVLGEDFTRLSHAEKDALRGERMGYVFQLFNLIPYLSVIQNITLPCRIHSKRCLKLEGKSSAEEAERLTAALSIAEYLHRPVLELSVGQQQRVAAARALIGAPEFIIADEPTSSLDHSQRGKFIELLMSECDKKKTSLLFVSHDPTLASFFDRTVEMNEINVANQEATK